MLGMQDNNFRELRRDTNRLLTIKRAALQEGNPEEFPHEPVKFMK